MLLQAILVTRDAVCAALVSSAFRGAVVDVLVVPDLLAATNAITEGKWDAVIVDYESVSEAASVFSALRRSKSNQRAIGFALSPKAMSAAELYNDGANFVIEKPLNAERLVAALRAGHALMVTERRRYLRHPIEGSCWLKSDRGEYQLNLVNVSEGGLCVEIADLTAKGLDGSARFRFFLPGSNVPIHGKATLAWYRNGRAGMRFSSLSRDSRDELVRWLSRHFDLASAEALNAVVAR